jgi:hypothetical protein
MDPNRMLMQQREYAEKLDQEREGYEEQPESVLADTDFPAPNAEQKELSDDYSADPFEHKIVVQNEYKSDFTIAGGKTPAAKTSSDYPIQEKSPISGTNELLAPRVPLVLTEFKVCKASKASKAYKDIMVCRVQPAFKAFRVSKDRPVHKV